MDRETRERRKRDGEIMVDSGEYAPPTLEAVKRSEFGCRNCLWNSCECTQGSKFQPARTVEAMPTCKAYTYYD